eukprot:TRINITY_DN9152_c0_g1_i1.p1 TRINITY_DN9152_c0_g1~~TRINITY_DN9152_c0_g1_i1.p1  ORF type:complete len:340 (+),score=127.51 TRINITY_DN9152_c0_g1_i1:86-1105(+)
MGKNSAKGALGKQRMALLKAPGKKKVKGQGKIGKTAAKYLLECRTGKELLGERQRQGEKARAGKQQPPGKKGKAMTKRQMRQAQQQLYPEDTRLLLVGEGDFSFTAALAKLRGHGGGIISTSYDTSEQLSKKYPWVSKQLEACEEAGVVVVHGVDATALENCDAINGTDGTLDHIIFNFPHTGCGIKDKTRNVATNKDLLRKFFVSAKEFIPETGSIHVALKRGEPYDSWNIRALAKDAGLVLKTTFPFDPEMFPGYAHCKTAAIPDGSTGGDNAIINKYGARIWVFEAPSDDVQEVTEPPPFRHDLDDFESDDENLDFIPHANQMGLGKKVNTLRKGR